MAYLGNVPARSFISFERQVFTIVNSQTAYTLSHSVTNENDIRLVVNNVVQEPGSGKAYTASGTTLTLSAALTNGTDEMYCVFLGRAVGTVNAPAGSVGTSQLIDLNVTTGKIAADAITNAKIADDAISDEQLDPTVITGQTAETSIATDDLILLSDTSASGALKKMTRANFVSGVGGTNTPYFFANSGSVTSIANNAYTKVAFTNEVLDTANNFASSRFTPTTAGKYILHYSVGVNFGYDASAVYPILFINGSENGSATRIRKFHNGSEAAIQTYHTTAIVSANGTGDYYEIYFYQNSGSARDTYNSTNDTFFFGYKIIE